MMTIDVTIPRETKSLILPLQRTFYPTPIPEQHHQLKNFISTSTANVIYYASERNIYALHLASQRREIIESLPWEPQCLDAGHGWICVGGSEKGKCAFICIGEDSSNVARTSDRALFRPVEVDALLPLDLDPDSRLVAHGFLERSSTLNRRKPEVQMQEIGSCIVNSVTIHRMCSESKGVEDEIVAVLTNNDKTVTIYSLSQSRPLQVISFPTPMNHASISPDGKLLLAVGDEPRAFFCRRVRLVSPAQEGEAAYARYQWHKVADPKLRLADSSDSCFTTAFSPAGHICAVASQTGVVIIFDTKKIRDDMDADEAVITVLKSSRPSLANDFVGAVRSMSFAPAPWDLLAWGEDQGRVCIVDLRNAFGSRQTLELETSSPSINRAILSDLEQHLNTIEQHNLERQLGFVQRHREAFDAQNHIAAVNHAADYMEFAAERRRFERAMQEGPSPALLEDFNVLTESERQILDAHRTVRLQESQQSLSDPTQQQTINETIPSPNEDLPDTQDSSQIASRRHQAAGSLRSTSPHRSTSSLREYIRQRDLERTRTGDRTYQPRRRSSVVITNDAILTPSSSSPSSSLAPIGSATPALSASPSRLASTVDVTASAPSSGDPWQTIVEAIAPANSAGDAATRLRRERDYTTATRALDRRIAQQQQQAARLERVRNTSANVARLRQLHGMSTGRSGGIELMYDDEIDLLRRFTESRGRRDDGIGIMGVGWSNDGRNLFVATEEGILQYTVNIEERKTFPGVALL